MLAFLSDVEGAGATWAAAAANPINAPVLCPACAANGVTL
jgi:hypothetical protein